MNQYKISSRGVELVLALPDRDKVAALKSRWAREDRKRCFTKRCTPTRRRDGGGSNGR